MSQTNSKDSLTFDNVVTYLNENDNISSALSLNNELFLKVTEQKDSSGISRAHNLYGWIYERMMKYDWALHHYRLALATEKAEKYEAQELIILNNMGITYREISVYEAKNSEEKLKNLHKAISHFKKAYEKALPYEFPETDPSYIYPIYNLGLTYDYLAEEYVLLKEMEQAATYYEKSHTYFKKLVDLTSSFEFDDVELIDIYHYTGNYYAFKYENTKAMFYYNKSFEVINRMDDPLNHFSLYRDVIRFYKRNEGNYERAAQYSDSLYKYALETQNRTNKSANKSNQLILDFEQTKFDLEKSKLEQKVQEKEAQRSKSLSFFVLAICLILFISAIAFYRKSKESNSLRIKAESALQQKISLEEKINQIEDSIAADLHDNFGNKLNNVITAHETLKKVNLKQKENQENVGKLSSLLEDNLKSLSTDIQDLLWANNSKNNKLHNVIIRIRSYLLELEKYNPEIKTKFSTNYNSKTKNIILPKLANRQILFIVKEATHNAIKYSKTKIVEVAVNVSEQEYLEIECKDYGIGFDRNELVRINGLNHMEMRSKTIDFKFSIDTAPNKGTIIKIRSNSSLRPQIVEQIS